MFGSLSNLHVRRPKSPHFGVFKHAQMRYSQVRGAHLAELTRVRDGLRSLVDACPGHGEMDCCTILAALSKEDA